MTEAALVIALGADLVLVQGSVPLALGADLVRVAMSKVALAAAASALAGDVAFAVLTLGFVEFFPRLWEFAFAAFEGDRFHKFKIRTVVAISLSQY